MRKITHAHRLVYFNRIESQFSISAGECSCIIHILDFILYSGMSTRTNMIITNSMHASNWIYECFGTMKEGRRIQFANEFNQTKGRWVKNQFNKFLVTPRMKWMPRAPTAKIYKIMTKICIIYPFLVPHYLNSKQLFFGRTHFQRTSYALWARSFHQKVLFRYRILMSLRCAMIWWPSPPSSPFVISLKWWNSNETGWLLTLSIDIYFFVFFIWN